MADSYNLNNATLFPNQKGNKTIGHLLKAGLNKGDVQVKSKQQDSQKYYNAV